MPTPSAVQLSLVNRFLNFNINQDEELCDIAELAAAVFSVPFAVITLTGTGRQYTNSKISKKAVEDLDKAPLYQYFISQHKTIVVDDIAVKKNLKNKAIVIQKRKVNFYASIPLITHDGLYAGNLLLMDYKPGRLKKAQKEMLKTLVKRIVHLIEFDYSLHVVKTQHAAAKETEIKLRSFFESSAACHLLIGKELEVIVFNRNMAEFIESHHHVTLYPGINVDKILRGPYLQDFILDYERALNGTPVMYEREVVYEEKTIWWYVTFEPGYNATGEIVGISYNAMDITERKRHERKILDQNSSLKTIAHIQSHELRKPVASILGFMYLFKHEGYQATSEELMMMERAVDELDKKIREIVKISTPAE
jgi:PAS domain S-box-containing protein